MANFVDRVKKAEATVKKAKADHVNAVDEAEKALRQAESAYAAALKHVEKQIDDVEKEYAQKIGSFGSITLYRDHIKGSGKTFKLDSSVVAKVDVDGDIYASRAADGGREISRIATTRQADGPPSSDAEPSPEEGTAQAADAAQEAQDDQEISAKHAKPTTRSSSKPRGAHARDENAPPQKTSMLYLTVESNHGRIGAQAKPDRLSDARNFALQIAAVSAAAEAGEKEKEAKIAALRSQLTQAKGQTADVEKAKAFLNSVEADNATVVAAERNLTTLMGKASRKDLVALSERQLKIKKRKRNLIIAIIAIVVVAIIAVVVYMTLSQ